MQHVANLQNLHNQVEEFFGTAAASDYLESLNVVTRSFLNEELSLEENNVVFTQDVIFHMDQLKVFLVKMMELV